MDPKRTLNWELLISAIVILATILLMIAYYNRLFSFAARVGPYRIIHYIAFTGTLYIAIVMPLFSMFKRRFSNKYKMLLRTHVFGNLLSFLLISLHFAGQVGRPADFYPVFGTGLALYIAMALQTTSGIVLRFKLLRSLSPATNRFVHVGLAFVFYIVIVIHILHGIDII